MVIYADDALKQLRDACKDYNFEMTDLSESRVLANVTLNGITTEVWFDVDRQLFIFKLFQGGCKSFQNIEAFKGVFSNYMHCYGVLKPIATHITAYFEKEFGIQTVFNTISGNVQNGFRAIFSQVGSDNEIHVYELGDNYRADYIEYNSDRTANTLLATKLYSEDYEEVLTLDFYLESLMLNCYPSSNGVELRKVSSDVFRISGAGTICDIKFMVEDSEVVVHIESAKSDDFELESSNLFVELKNPYDLMEVIRRVEEYKVEQISREEAELEAQVEADKVLNVSDSNEAENNKSTEITQEGLVEDITQEESQENIPQEESMKGVQSTDEIQEISSEPDVVVDEEVSNLEVDKNTPECSNDNLFDEDSNDTIKEEVINDVVEEDVCEQAQESIEICNTEETSQSLVKEEVLSVKMELKAIKNNEETVGVLILDNDTPYSISVETASGVGIPVKRLDSCTNLVSFRGIKVTEDEKRLKKFAQDLNEDRDKVLDLLSSFFDE